MVTAAGDVCAAPSAGTEAQAFATGTPRGTQPRGLGVLRLLLHPPTRTDEQRHVQASSATLTSVSL